MLRYLDERGVRLGDELEVLERQPFDGPLTVRFGDGLHVLGGTLARAMRVERTCPDPSEGRREAPARLLDAVLLRRCSAAWLRPRGRRPRRSASRSPTASACPTSARRHDVHRRRHVGASRSQGRRGLREPRRRQSTSCTSHGVNWNAGRRARQPVRLPGGRAAGVGAGSRPLQAAPRLSCCAPTPAPRRATARSTPRTCNTLRPEAAVRRRGEPREAALERLGQGDGDGARRRPRLPQEEQDVAVTVRASGRAVGLPRRLGLHDGCGSTRRYGTDYGAASPPAVRRASRTSRQVPLGV